MNDDLLAALLAPEPKETTKATLPLLDGTHIATPEARPGTMDIAPPLDEKTPT
jgi:hypothetical protein